MARIQKTTKFREAGFECNGLISSFDRDPLLPVMGDYRADNAKWTRGATIRFQKYTPPKPEWDHDHCEACWAKFMKSGSADVLTEGYVTQDNRWICAACFCDLHEEMGWKLVGQINE